MGGSSSSVSHKTEMFQAGSMEARKGRPSIAISLASAVSGASSGHRSDLRSDMPSVHSFKGIRFRTHSGPPREETDSLNPRTARLMSMGWGTIAHDSPSEDCLGLNTRQRADLRRVWDHITSEMSDFSMKYHYRLMKEIPEFKGMYTSYLNETLSDLALEARMQTHTFKMLDLFCEISKLMNDSEAVHSILFNLHEEHKDFGMEKETLLNQDIILHEFIKKEYPMDMDEDTDYALKLFFGAITTNFAELSGLRDVRPRSASFAKRKSVQIEESPDIYSRDSKYPETFSSIPTDPADNAEERKGSKRSIELVDKSTTKTKFKLCPWRKNKESQESIAAVELQEWQKRLLALHEETIRKDKSKCKLNCCVNKGEED